MKFNSTSATEDHVPMPLVRRPRHRVLVPAQALVAPLPALRVQRSCRTEPLHHWLGGTRKQDAYTSTHMIQGWHDPRHPHRRHGRTCSAAPYFLALTRSRRRQVAPASSARTQATRRPQLAAGATVPPVLGGGSPVTVPPVLGIPLPLPPVLGGGSPKTSSPKVRHGGRKACPPPPSPPTPTPSPPSDTCPMDALKLGACVDLLGNEVHIGDANVQFCPLVKGVAGQSAAACLCTAIKAKVLDLSVYVPIALEVLANCGCAVPPGYTRA